MTRAPIRWCVILVGCAAVGASCKKKPPPPPSTGNAPIPTGAAPAPERQPPSTRVRATAPGKAVRPPRRIRAMPLGPKVLARLAKLRLPKCPEQRLWRRRSFALRAPATSHNEDLLATFTCGAAAKVRFVQIDGSRIRRVLSDHPANAWAVSSVDALAFRDVNGDGLPDFIAVVSAMTGIGPTGARPFRVGGFWLGTADGQWRQDAGASSLLGKLREVTVRSMVRVLRRHYRQ